MLQFLITNRIVLLMLLLTKQLTLGDLQYSCDRQVLPDASSDEITQLADFNVLMESHEKVFFWRQLQSHKIYFEFGAGGSTNLACRSQITKIYTVESDKTFLNNVFNSSNCLMNTNSPLNHRYVDIHVNIGETVAFGHPKSLEKSYDFHNYPEQILKLKDNVELILVDGRFRVACTLYSLLAIGNDGHILIHDFFIRPHYYKVLEYAQIVDCLGTMVKLKKKYNINWKSLMTDILIYVNDPR